MKTHTKYYRIAGITLQVHCELPITDNTFAPKFKIFEIDRPSGELFTITHHFDWDEDSEPEKYDKQIYFRPPWAIYQEKNNIIYHWIEPHEPFKHCNRKGIADFSHSKIDIFSHPRLIENFNKGSLTSLTFFPTDQILLGRLLGYRDGCIIHSLGIILQGNGYLFVGHSDAGKSTLATILKKEAEILCDDRNIIRKINDYFNVFGTWSHGDVSDVSANGALLKGIFFLEQSEITKIEKINDQKQIFKTLLACLIRPVGTVDWWDHSLDLISMVSSQIPCWNLKFDKSDTVINLIKDFN